MGILGSCATRDVFTTYHNDYKNHFSLVFSHERISLISLFQEPLKFDMEDIKIFPENPTNKFRTNKIRQDFEKSFFNDLDKGIDYLVIDFYFEALFGTLIIDDDLIITNNVWDLPSTAFYENLNKKENFSMYDNGEKYFESWQKSCDKLFNHLKSHHPDVKVILNRIRLTDIVLRDDYSSYINDGFHWIVKTYPPFIKKFEDYVIDKYDVDIIESGDPVFTSEASRWRPYVIHFTDEYYRGLYYELCKLVGVDESHLLKSQLNYLTAKSELYENIIKNMQFEDDENPKKSDGIGEMLNITKQRISRFNQKIRK